MAKDTISKNESLSEAKIDLILRILYSFKKMASTSVKEEYSCLAARMAADDHLDFSTKSGIDGMSQTLMAVLCSTSSNEGEGPVVEALKSETCFVSIIQEACVQEVRRKFRLKSGGDKGKARELATDFITSLLGVDAKSAPCTQPQMEAELPTDNVRLDCDDSFHFDSQMTHQVMSWVRNIVMQWCRAWSFARDFCKIVTSRGGGWNKIERDMETGFRNYEDVINSLRKVKLQTPRQILGLDADEAQPFFLKIGVGAIFTGVLD